MKLRIFFTALFVANLFVAKASEDLFGRKKKKQFFSQTSLGLASGHNSTYSLSLWSNLPLNYKRFEFGVGVRLTRSSFENAAFVTAPSALTRGSSGPMSVFDSKIPANMDTFYTGSRYNQLALNAGFFARYFIKSLFLKSVKLYAEVNFDVAGFGFGPSVNGKFQSNGGMSDAGAKPAGINLFKVSDNNIGSLNSEFVIKAKILNRIVVYGGYTLTMNELVTSNTVQQTAGMSNDRFRNRSSGIVLGVQWVFNK